MNHVYSHLRRVTAPPAIIRQKRNDGSTRLLLVDDAVLAPMRGFLPFDEPSAAVQFLEHFRPLRMNMTSRIRA